MCKKVICEFCKKPTYEGCGKHIESVLADVPEEERCKCDEEENVKISYENSHPR